MTKKQKSAPKKKKKIIKEFIPKSNVVISEITYSEGITVGELAEKCNRTSSEIIKMLFMLGKQYFG